MPYYRILLVAHLDFTHDSGAWRTYQDLKLAGHAVEVLDPVRHPGILDEQGKLHEELVTPIRKVFAPDYVACEGESAASILSSLSKITAHEGPSPRHFVVFGYVGPNNFGDEFIFDTICNHLYERYPGSYVTLIGHDPASALARHGVASVTPLDKAEVLAMLNGASSLVFMAGIMFDDPFIQWTAGPIDLFLNPHSEIAGQVAMTQLAYLAGTPAVFLGIGAGPLEHPDSRRLIRLEALTGPTYITRDATTTRLLAQAGVNSKQIVQKADLAFSAAYPQKLSESAYDILRNAGVNPDAYAVAALRDHKTWSATLEQNLIEAFSSLYQRRGIPTLLLAFAPEDQALNNRIASRAPQAVRSVNCCTDNDAMTSLIGHARLTLGMRLHCSIIAAAQGTPAIGLNYNVKVKELYEQFKGNLTLLPMTASAKELERAVEDALHCDEQRSTAIAQVARSNRQLAEEAFTLLYQIVDHHEAEPHEQTTYTRSVSVDRLEAERLACELDAERARRIAAEERIAAIESSTSWKVASGLAKAAHRLPRREPK